MSSRLKGTLRIVAIVLGLLVVVVGSGYLTLFLRTLKPPGEVGSLAELEA